MTGFNKMPRRGVIVPRLEGRTFGMLTMVHGGPMTVRLGSAHRRLLTRPRRIMGPRRIMEPRGGDGASAYRMGDSGEACGMPGGTSPLDGVGVCRLTGEVFVLSFNAALSCWGSGPSGPALGEVSRMIPFCCFRPIRSPAPQVATARPT